MGKRRTERDYRMKDDKKRCGKEKEKKRDLKKEVKRRRKTEHQIQVKSEKSRREKERKREMKKEGDKKKREKQAWEFAHSLITHLLICSFLSNQLSDCERFAQIAQDK